MNNIAHIQAFKPEQHTVEECLIEMEKYGYPRIGKFKSGWHSHIEVFVTGAGVDFEVKSQFSHATPASAVNQCYDRLIKALNQIKEGTT